MPRRFLLDENVPSSVQRLLREKGLNVTAVLGSAGRGLTNGEVAQIAISEDRIVITLDADFLSLRRNLVQTKVIYVSVHPRNPRVISEIIEKHLDACVTMLGAVNAVILSREGPSPMSTRT